MILHLNVQLEKGLTSKKIEGDEKTPKGIFKLDKLYFEKIDIKSQILN